MFVEVNVPGAGVTWAEALLAFGALATVAGVLWQIRLSRKQHHGEMKASREHHHDEMQLTREQHHDEMEAARESRELAFRPVFRITRAVRTAEDEIALYVKNIGPGPGPLMSIELWLLRPNFDYDRARGVDLTGLPHVESSELNGLAAGEELRYPVKVPPDDFRATKAVALRLTYWDVFRSPFYMPDDGPEEVAPTPMVLRLE